MIIFSHKVIERIKTFILHATISFQKIVPCMR